jgi:hypothetical protein
LAAAEFGGRALYITEGLQHRREYERNNPTSQTLGTLSEMFLACKSNGSNQKQISQDLR